MEFEDSILGGSKKLVSSPVMPDVSLGMNKLVRRVGLLQKSAGFPSVLPLGCSSDPLTILLAVLEAGINTRGYVSQDSVSLCPTVAGSVLDECVSVNVTLV